MTDKGEELLNSETGGEKVPPQLSPLPPSLMESSHSSATDSGDRQSDSDRARQEEEWRSDLFRLENEMSTLKSVLASKTKEAEELKRKLGITVLVELKEDIKLGFQSFKGSEPIQKTSAAFKDFGDYASKKLDHLRHSNAFKSMEEKVGGAYSSVKKRISSAKSETEDIEEEEAVEATETGVTDEVAAVSPEGYAPIKP